MVWLWDMYIQRRLESAYMAMLVYHGYTHGQFAAYKYKVSSERQRHRSTDWSESSQLAHLTVLVSLRSAKLYESQRQKMRECVGVGVGVCVRACVCVLKYIFSRYFPKY